MTPAAAELEMIHESVADIRCPRCGAPVGRRCVNPITKRPSHVPCLARIRAVDEVPA